jgi:hypothetical protein
MDDPAAGGHQDAEGENEALVAVKLADDFFMGIWRRGLQPLCGKL